MGGPIRQADLRGGDGAEQRSPLVRAHLGAEDVHLGEYTERLFDVAGGQQRTSEYAERVAAAVPIRHRREEVAGFPRRFDGRRRSAGEQPQRREQHEHHADGPPVAPLAGLAEHLLGQPFGFGVAALVEANPREQPERPAEPAGVADLGERGR